MIFFNVGWMRNYKGLDSANDRIVGGGSYIQKQGFGHEILNFQPYDGYMYGFVQAKGGINIKRLGGSETDSEVNDILVVWVARNPRGGTFIVGWYDKATIYQTLQMPPRGSKRVYKNQPIRYLVKAKDGYCHRLDLDKRTFLIPRQKKGGIGQSNVWYADKSNHLELKREVLKFIDNDGFLQHALKKSASKFFARQSDPHKRKKIELRAIETTISYYEKLGYIVRSVQGDNVGWDLEATHETKSLKLEVKGLSGDIVIVELTPNEYAKMKDHQDDYRVCVVTNALSHHPSLRILSYSYETGNWEDDDGNRAVINEVISAKLHVTVRKA